MTECHFINENKYKHIACEISKLNRVLNSWRTYAVLWDVWNGHNAQELSGGYRNDTEVSWVEICSDLVCRLDTGRGCGEASSSVSQHLKASDILSRWWWNSERHLSWVHKIVKCACRPYLKCYNEFSNREVFSGVDFTRID